MLDKCPICDTSLPPYEWAASGSQRIGCPVCGQYRIWEPPATQAFYGVLKNRYLYSGAIRDLTERGVDVNIRDFDLLESVTVPDGPLAQIDRIVLYVYRHTPSAEAKVKLLDNDYAIAYAKHAQEFKYLIDRANELGYLDRNRNGSEDTCWLTITGWKHVAELRKQERVINQAFVAMSFDPSLRSVYLDAIKSALNETGYVPLRVDEAEYNEKIDDRIVADIRKSGLVIADFTQHKAGVYFEAGFAQGLGIPVIWTCRDDDIANAHFDTRQYNHITWKDAKDLQQKLIARIEATVPLKSGSNREKVG